VIGRWSGRISSLLRGRRPPIEGAWVFWYCWRAPLPQKYPLPWWGIQSAGTRWPELVHPVAGVLHGGSKECCSGPAVHTWRDRTASWSKLSWRRHQHTVDNMLPVELSSDSAWIRELDTGQFDSAFPYRWPAVPPLDTDPHNPPARTQIWPHNYSCRSLHWFHKLVMVRHTDLFDMRTNRQLDLEGWLLAIHRHFDECVLEYRRPHLGGRMNSSKLWRLLK